MTREELIKCCERGFVDQNKWHNRDSPDAQLQLGQAYALLKAGCEFDIQNNSDERTWWVQIYYLTFSDFEYGTRPSGSDTFYIPTQARLDMANGEDWY